MHSCVWVESATALLSSWMHLQTTWIQSTLKQDKTELKQSANCSSWKRDSTLTVLPRAREEKCFRSRTHEQFGPNSFEEQGWGMRETRTGSSQRSHKGIQTEGTVALTNSWQSRERHGHHWTDFKAHIQNATVEDCCPSYTSTMIKHVQIANKKISCLATTCNSSSSPTFCDPDEQCEEEELDIVFVHVWEGATKEANLQGLSCWNIWKFLFDISWPWCKQHTTQCHVARYFHTSSASGNISINIKQYSIIMPVGTPLMYTKSAKADLWQWQGPMFWKFNSGEPFSRWALAPASSKGVWWKWAASPDPPGGSNGSTGFQEIHSAKTEEKAHSSGITSVWAFRAKSGHLVHQAWHKHWSSQSKSFKQFRFICNYISY